MRFEGKVALITGGAGGMGSIEARMYAKEGAAVIIADLADEAGETLAEEVSAQGGKALFVHLDVTDETQWIAAAEKVKETFGALHILVNNAGINGGKPIPVEDVAAWNKIYAVNVTGPMLGMKHFCRLMRDSGGGAIVNIASTAGTNAHFLAAYSSSKWALRGLSRSAALTFGPWNIRSNVVCPGIINTQLGSGLGAQATAAFIKANAIERMGEPEEVANMVLFLSSDEASFITGQEISVDGGFDGTAAYGTLARGSGMLEQTLKHF